MRWMIAIAVVGCSSEHVDPTPPPTPTIRDPEAAKIHPDRSHELRPEEGRLSIWAPGSVRVGAEAVATIRLEPGPGFEVNTKHPVKLELAPVPELAVAQETKRLDDHQLALALRVTPRAPGNFDVSGTLGVAVCSSNTCIEKHLPIHVAIPAK